MFSYLNAFVDLSKKQTQYITDTIPDSDFKGAMVKFTTANFDLAYKTVEVTNSYLDNLKKVFVK